jgi:NAD(P)-dependent dehydrogenase (short-subunit alcohol dehydrogenase family)
MRVLLDDKTAVIYGAGGSIGGAVARAFAREGARVFLAGRTRGKLDTVADEIRSDGGSAETDVVDALDEQAVDTYVDSVAERAGRIDVSFNLISFGDVQGTPLAEMSLEDFTRPVTTIVRTQFLTTRAAARYMTKQEAGVILAFGGTGEPVPLLGGLCVAFDAVESLRRQWACELGPHGVRFVTIKTGGVPETVPGNFAGRDDIVAGIEKAALLNRTATLADVGNLAAFVASDHARTMTSATVNISCGAIVDF